MSVKVDLQRCTGCGRCVNACPQEVIRIQSGKAVIGEGCVECGACVSVCPRGAISF